MDNINPEAGSEAQPQSAIDDTAEGLHPGTGGAPPDSDPGAQTPELVEYKYDGKTFNVPPELADALKKRDDDYNAGFGQVKSELETLRASLPANPPPGDANPAGDSEDLLNRLLENPKGVFDEWKQEIEQDLTKKYQGAEQAKEFERGFWDQNKELVPHKVVFNGYMAENAHRWIVEKLSDQQAYDKCAEMTRRYVLEHGGKVTAPSVHTEGPGQPAAPTTQTDQPPPRTKTISDVMREHKAREEAGPARPAAAGG